MRDDGTIYRTEFQIPRIQISKPFYMDFDPNNTAELEFEKPEYDLIWDSGKPFKQIGRNKGKPRTRKFITDRLKAYVLRLNIATSFQKSISYNLFFTRCIQSVSLSPISIESPHKSRILTSNGEFYNFVVATDL